jgi:GntR family transcriptional regulator
MEFKENKAIYLQIADYVCEQVLLGKWSEGKIPSVRELAVILEVNPNTVMRTYELLQNKEIITIKRGIGFFTTDEADKKIKIYRKEQFIHSELPAVFKNIYLLNIQFEELNERYQKFVKETFNPGKI